MSSFDVVFPLLPVIAIIGISKYFLWKWAKSCRASKTLLTTINLSFSISGSSSTTENKAPNSIASVANLLALKLSPLRAKNIVPDLIERVSVETPFEFKNKLWRSLIFRF